MSSESGSPAARLDALLAHAPDASSAVRAEATPLVRELLASDDGAGALLARMPPLVAAGLFRDTVWEEPARLLPPLVKGSLLGPEPLSILEAVSELRLLAIALGDLSHQGFSSEAATRFLQDAVVLNLDLVQMGASEQHRLAGGAALSRARRVIGLIVDRLPFRRFERVLLEEIDAICRQRRILTAAAHDMVARAARYADPEGTREQRRLARYVAAVNGVTERAGSEDVGAYGAWLRRAADEELDREARAFGRSLRELGLAGSAHALLVRELSSRRHLPMLGRALGIDRVGRAELARHASLVEALVEGAVTEATPLAVPGLAGCLERTVLSQIEVAAGLRNLLRRPPCEAAAARLVASRAYDDRPTDPHALLVAGALAVLGRPLGLGQGDNPSCQGARGLSLWSQVAPGYLLELLTTAAYDNCTRIRFRGVELVSSELPAAPMGTELRLDPASVVLVPHLQRTYQAMLALVQDEPGDPHRYVNPGLYGPWIPTGFSSATDEPDLASFFRRFLAVHHPAAAAVEPIHPRPVGLVVTSVSGQYLGLHAISLLRVEPYGGALRAYFYNPNDDGRQNWGQGIVASTSGHGERPGESSVPLPQLASRIYAFHFHEHELEGLETVPHDELREAVDLAESSWWPALRGAP